MLLLATLRSLRQERRQLGWRGLLRKRGWALVAIVAVAYLVRDLVLYVAVPLLIATGFRSP